MHRLSDRLMPWQLIFAHTTVLQTLTVVSDFCDCLKRVCSWRCSSSRSVYFLHSAASFSSVLSRELRARNTCSKTYENGSLSLVLFNDTWSQFHFEHSVSCTKCMIILWSMWLSSKSPNQKSGHKVKWVISLMIAHEVWVSRYNTNENVSSLLQIHCRQCSSYRSLNL